tara:strand:+ start:3011 stop:3136 length:126 start_codon:yes stop_codon:yes gene_type:complete
MFPVPHTPDEWISFLISFSAIASVFFLSGYFLGRLLISDDS